VHPFAFVTFESADGFENEREVAGIEVSEYYVQQVLCVFANTSAVFS